ncbi:MAG: CHASE domain-containing protein [Planctomycetota bacterium]
MRCPSENVLRWLVEDELKPAARDQTAEHVDCCVACQEVLERMTATPETLYARQPRAGAYREERDDFLRRLKNSSSLTQLQPSSGGGNGRIPTPSRADSMSNQGSSGLPSIAGYQVVEEIGQGGMGVVYLAVEERLDRRVALKVVDTRRLPDGTRAERFRAEALATARLKHSNIIEIYDVGEHDGLAYLALEYAERGSLRDRLRRETLSWVEIARVAEAIATAVQAAHDSGFVHRDLKPANVLFTDDGTLKISDFGLAKQMGGDSGLTRTGDVIGSPSYMAPEQLAGRHAELGPATDVYAIGAVLYELLTGDPPFQGATSVETLLQVRERDPKTPSSVRQRVPVDLETICLKCLEKDARQRYASAGEVADELRRFQQHEPINASAQGLFHRVNRWRQRNVGVSRVCLTIVLFGPLLSFAVAWRLQSAERQGMIERFDRVASEQVAAIQRQAEIQLTLLDPVATHVMVSETLTRDRFSHFARRVVALQPAIAALEWVPRVPAGDRNRHEKEAAAEGLVDYRIRWKNQFGQFCPAEEAEAYYPVLYAEPEAPNRQALGFDLGSNLTRHAALTRSLAERRTIISAPISLVQDTNATPSFLAFTPVFSIATLAENSAGDAEGLIVGVYRVRDVVAAALQQTKSAGLTLRLTDESGDRLWESKELAEYAGDSGLIEHQRSESILVGGRTWEVAVRATRDYAGLERSREPMLVVVLAIILSWGIAGGVAARTVTFN